MAKRYKKKLKVFGVPWHTAHQADLAKLPWVESYDLVINPYRSWATVHRPFPDNCNMVTSFEAGKYDYAILHVDQQSIYNPDEGDRISKGRLFSEIKETIEREDPDLPIFVINHNTPFHDKYESEKVVDIIKELIGKHEMIVNSHQSRKQWGWGATIVHGMDVDEWWDLPKEPRVVVSLSPAGMEKSYRRVFLRSVRQLLADKGIPFVWIGVEKKFNTFAAYRDFLGRSLVYFHPAWQSPMPRARTEAMLSGSCVVTTPYQDADSFIKDGVNGFLTSKETYKDPRIMDSPEYTANLIEKLIVETPDLAQKVGQEGRKTARKLFNRKNFADQWEKYLVERGVLCLEEK